MFEPSGPRSPFDLHGRVAIITGGSRGIGKGIALGLAGAGADVAIWARDAAQAEATAAEVARFGVRTNAVACDVASEQDVERACAETVSELGRIDVCFANAGGGDAYDPLKVSLERWRRLLSVNLGRSLPNTAGDRKTYGLMGRRREARRDLFHHGNSRHSEPSRICGKQRFARRTRPIPRDRIGKT